MRITPLLITVIACSLASPTLARDGAATAIERERVADTLQCTRKSGKDVGNCLRDKLKSLEEGYRQFLKRQDAAMEAWRLEHADMGRTPEYERALREKQTALNAERQAYNDRLSDLRRSIEAERKQVRDTSSTRPVTGSAATKPATKNKDCFTGSRLLQRQCLRNALYPREATRRADKQDETR